MAVKVFDQDPNKSRIDQRKDARISQAEKDKIREKGFKNIKKDLK